MRRLLVLLVGAALVATPIFLSQDGGFSDFVGVGQNPAADQSWGNGYDTGVAGQLLGPGSQPAPSQNPIVWPGPTEPPQQLFLPVNDLKNVLRFDIYPEWVKANWDRVTRIPGELEMEGLRVPLVTGYGPADLSGSLTYYFDQRRQIQRIRFQGWTVDASALIAHLSEQYSFRRARNAQADLYVKKTWSGKVHSLLKLDPAAELRSDLPRRRIFVFLELNHPQGNLPPGFDAQQILDAELAP